MNVADPPRQSPKLNRFCKGLAYGVVVGWLIRNASADQAHTRLFKRTVMGIGFFGTKLDTICPLEFSVGFGRNNGACDKNDGVVRRVYPVSHAKKVARLPRLRFVWRYMAKIN